MADRGAAPGVVMSSIVEIVSSPDASRHPLFDDPVLDSTCSLRHQ
jgi:hypothetical protein